MKANLGICALVILLVGCSPAELEKVKLAELDGDRVELDELQGKTVFINFWATSCRPCIQEMPTIEEAQRALRDSDVVFLLASYESKEVIEEFQKSRPFSFHYVQLLNMEELNIAALPTTRIFDHKGNLKFSETGIRDWSEPANLQLITE